MNRRPLQPCGTYAAWQRHYRAGEDPCPEDVQAKRAYQAAYREQAGRSDVANPQTRAYQRARRRALERLAKTYSTAFAQLLDEERAKEKDDQK